MTYTIVLAPRAQEDLNRIKKSGDQAKIKKLRNILIELSEHPFTGTGKPEALKKRPNTYS